MTNPMGPAPDNEVGPEAQTSPALGLMLASEDDQKKRPTPTPVRKGIVERAGGRQARRVVFYLDPDQAEALRRRAFDEGRDMSTIVAQLVDQWLKS